MKGRDDSNALVGRLVPALAREKFARLLAATLVVSLFVPTFNARADHRHESEPTHEHEHASGQSYRHAQSHGHDHGQSALAETASQPEIARVLQRVHRFDEAAAKLAEHLEGNALDVDAQLLHADVLQHAGRLAEARNACVRVAVAGAPTLAAYCAAQVLLAEGEFVRADETCEKFADARRRLPESARQWALEISAVSAWRAGRLGAAQALFDQALDFDDLPHSTTAALIEFRGSD